MGKIKEIKKSFLLYFVPPLVFCLIKVLHFLCREEYKISPKIEEFLDENKNFIIAFWHGNLLMQPVNFKRFFKSDHQKVFVLISQHFDGEIIAQTMSCFGINSLRGSSSKGSARVLLSGIRKLQENSFVAITPDGPRGPYHSIADGIVLLSQKTHKPIVVSYARYHNAWELKSWDRFQIPKPFSKITYYVKEPFWVEGLKIEEAKKIILEKMEDYKLDTH